MLPQMRSNNVEKVLAMMQPTTCSLAALGLFKLPKGKDQVDPGCSQCVIVGGSSPSHRERGESTTHGKAPPGPIGL